MSYPKTLGMLWTAVVALGSGGVIQAQEGFFGDERPLCCETRDENGRRG